MCLGVCYDVIKFFDMCKAPSFQYIWDAPQVLSIIILVRWLWQLWERSQWDKPTRTAPLGSNCCHPEERLWPLPAQSIPDVWPPLTPTLFLWTSSSLYTEGPFPSSLQGWLIIQYSAQMEPFQRDIPWPLPNVTPTSWSFSNTSAYFFPLQKSSLSEMFFCTYVFISFFFHSNVSDLVCLVYL